MPVQLFLLGPAQFVRHEQPIELGVAKAVALLAFLAVTRAPQPRDRLADLLWPASLPDASRKNLRNTLWTIRKTLGEDVLWYPDNDRIGLSEAVEVDVSAFESAAQSLPAVDAPALQQIAQLYRAPLLDGLVILDAPDFELWLSAERERLEQLYLRVLEALVAAHQAKAQWAHVIDIARQALAHDNLQEPMHRALMQAHAQLGERAEAMRQYDRLAHTLLNELGVEPLPETLALRQAIIDGTLQPVEIPSFSAAHRPRVAPEAQPPRWPFIGRREELALFDQELGLAAGGRARVALITGELGIGKSRLWQEWSRLQGACPTVLETRCLDTLQSLPFAPLTNLFNRQACFERLFGLPSPLAPVWLVELARLLPVIRQHRPELPAPDVLPPEEERRRLFEAFTQVLYALEERPLILFLDDVHWADQATLDWLAYLVNRMRDEALLLVCAYRSSDASAQLVNLAAGWEREGLARRLPLRNFTLEEAAQLLQALGGSAAQVEPLQTRSAGNPYFLIELCRAESGDTPPALAELVRARLERLPQAARQIVQAAAVLEDFDFATLRRTSGRGEEETLDALDALLGAAILAERRGQYEFSHPLVAAVVRDGLNIARRSFLHRRAAEALEATFAHNLGAVAGQLTRHYAQAGRPAQAARYAELAAERALDLTAFAEAAAFYQQSVQLEPSPVRRLRLGQALYMQGDLERARQALNGALAEFEAAGDDGNQAQVCLALAESYLPSGQGEQVIWWAERALSKLTPPEPEPLARAYYLLSAGGMQTGRALAEAETYLAKAIDLAMENNLSEMAARCRFELGNLMAQRGDLPKAIEAFRQSIELAHQAGASFLEVLGHNNLAYHAQLAGDLATAHQHIQTALDMADSLSLFVPRQYLYSTRGELALAHGQAEQATGWFQRALVEAEKNNNQALVANVRANLGLAARARGELDEALALQQAAWREAMNVAAPHLQIQIELWLVELHMQRNERAAAKEALARVEMKLLGSERAGLQQWAVRLKEELQSR